MNKNYFLLFFFLLFLICLIIISCKREQKQAYTIIPQKTLRKIELKQVNIKRFDIDLFQIDMSKLQSELMKLQDEYHFFLDTDLEDMRNVEQMESYLHDRSIRTMYEETMKVYEDITFLEVQLTDAFKRIKVILPEFEIPNVYTYISGGDFEYPIKYVNNHLLIALDMYLGQQFPVYSMWGIPQFVSYRMRKEHIIVDCMKEIARAQVDKNNVKSKSLLDKMIYEGKLLYFIDITLPHVHDSIKISYTASQLGWAEEYQGNVWSYFIEHDILHTTDIRTINKFVLDGPFTSTFSKNSPSRIGYYIGWQIVRHCMRNNNTFLIQDLFNEINSTKILQMSGYKPRKK
jgi:hypothetical protein